MAEYVEVTYRSFHNVDSIMAFNADKVMFSDGTILLVKDTLPSFRAYLDRKAAHHRGEVPVQLYG